jgi:hypothetical protein
MTFTQAVRPIRFLLKRKPAGKIHFIVGNILALRAGFPKNEISALAARYTLEHPAGLLIEIGRRSRGAGYYTRDDFVVMCESANSSKHCGAGSSRQIEDATRIALNTTSERERIRSLITLSGVSWPTASVFLHYTFEDQYPTLAPTTLWSWGCDKTDTNFEFWWAYVEANRSLRSECRVTMHTLDTALRQFAVDQRELEAYCSKATPDF